MNRLSAAVLVVAAAAACTTDVETPATGCDPAFDAWAVAGFSGSIAISTGGELECVTGYGTADAATGTPNTADSVFSIGSITKAFTAAAIVDLVDEGKLSLDDRAGDIVSGLPGPAADATVEQLLLHTSGLTGSHGADHEPLTRDEAVAAISALDLAVEPGSEFLYSNAGYTLLAFIVEEASASSYREYTAAELLVLPGGQVAGGFWNGEPRVPGPRAVGAPGESGDFAGPHWALDGNGGLAMTTGDLAVWTHALFAGEIVSADAVDMITGTRFDQGDGVSEVPGWVAYDDGTFGEPVFATAGGGGDVGHNAVVAWLPESERVIAMASNTPVISAEALLRAVGPALVAGRPLPAPDTAGGDADPADLAALAGTYELATGGSFDVIAEDDRLGVSAHGADAVAVLFPLPIASELTPDDVTAHEERVLALLAGETREGREERAAFESAVGPIDDVGLAGTVVEDGELRTHVTITSGTEAIGMWFALDEQGGVAAAELPADPPTLLLVPSAGETYRPDDPTGTGPDVTMTFDGNGLTVTGASGSTTAALAG